MPDHATAPAPRRFARLPLLVLVAGGLACSDAAGPDPVEPSGFDLLFDGEMAVGEPRLFRVSGRGGPAPVGAGVAGRRPAASPDGRRIAFQSLGTDEEPSRLMLAEAASGAALPLGAADGLAGEVSWSPDGRRIAFLSQRDDAAGDIFVADVSGGDLLAVRNLTPRDPANGLPQPDRTPAWSPDGARIAFANSRLGSAAIWVMNADGTGARAVTAAGQHMDYEPSWSPDGRWIAFQRASATGVRIGIVAAAGGTPRFLDWPARAYNPAWSPDGERIAFSSDVDGDMDIFVVSPRGDEVTRVRRPGTDRDAAWIRTRPSP